MEDLDSILGMPVHCEWRLLETIWSTVPFAGTYFTPNMPSTSNWDSTLGQICVLQCFADFQSSNISSHQSLHDVSRCLPWFSKGQCIECLVPAGNLQGFQRKFGNPRFRGGNAHASLGSQMFTMVSWWDASFWIHPDFICCSIVSGGHSNHSLIFSAVFCSSQCTMELRCIDW